MSRIFAISDIHVDIPENLRLVESWSASEYRNDVLILAGDVTDNLSLLKQVLQSLAQKFLKVCYVPGNHELWIRQVANAYCHENSIAKFHAILALCDSIDDVRIRPIKVQCCNNTAAWVVPIFSWYAKPEDDLQNSLFVGRDTEDAELSNKMWMDNHLCKWPALQGSVAQYFAKLNEDIVSRDYDAPVISFSHFLPRVELIPASDEEIKRVQEERKRLNLPSLDNPRAQGSQVQFNFTRFAGCKTIEEQIRKLGSKVHVHGHQHRNRDRVIDDVRYASFCLGYPRERSMGVIWGLSEGKGPRQIWP
ncbi:hypothetical protein ACROYT_G006209 [Oculina patagonica]